MSVHPHVEASARARRIVAATILCAAACFVYVLACGPFVEEIPTVAVVEPANLTTYAKGELGVVRPRLARRYLVQAYRVLSGRPPLPLGTLRADLAGDSGARAAVDPKSPETEWLELSARIAGAPAAAGQMKRVQGSSYQEFLNCADASFERALETLRSRIERDGERHAATIEWTRAQQIVFGNCESLTASIPPALPASADAAARADRDYQIATASFYAGQYDEAILRFRAIAQDTASPWRIYGRYLAARAQIRAATIPDQEAPDQPEKTRRRLAAAEADLDAVVADTSAAAIHPWARQLLAFVAARIHPVERLHALSRMLTADAGATSGDLDDYRWLMNQLVGDTIAYTYGGVAQRAEMIAGDDLTDWVLAMQGEGDTAPGERATTQWQATRSTPWLVAALWRMPASDPATAAALDAAAAVDRTSPAFPTVAVSRVRLLAAAGRRDEARRVLAAWPSAPEAGVDEETINLLRAERVMLADSLDEFLANAPRRPVLSAAAREARSAVADPPHGFDKPVLGDDAAVALNDWFPLDRIADAAASTALPAPLRARVASMALSRAIVLRRDEAGVRVARILRDLAPARRADLDRYIAAASDEARHAAGLFLLLHTPGMHAVLQTPDDDFSYRTADPDVEFDRLLRRNLWCGLDVRFAPGKRGAADSEAVGLLYAARTIPRPAFITVEEAAAAEREMRDVAALGPMRSYLGAAALGWARAKRRDVDVAEALALAVQQWHFGCGDEGRWDIARQAFTVLHAQYPQSDAAKRTRYWYK
jgi:hypothetical protein